MAREPGEEQRKWFIHVLGPSLLLVLWSLVLWGSLYACLLLRATLVEGPRAVLHRVLSGGDVVAGIVNLALAGLAPLVWGLVGFAFWRHRRLAGTSGRGANSDGRS